MNNDSPNTPKINAQVAALQLIRRLGALPVGWDTNEISPPTANALVKAGLAEIQTTEHGRFIFPKEQR